MSQRLQAGHSFEYSVFVRKLFLGTIHCIGVSCFNTSALHADFKEITEAFANPFDGSEIYLQSRLLALIYSIRSDSRRAAVNAAAESNSVTRALAYIDGKCFENITLGEIAQHVNLSRTYFHSLFTRAVSMTPQRYILQKRLGAAKTHLLMSQKSVSDIAYESGFSSQSYFNYVFKKETGVTPGNYKKMMYNKYPK